MKKIFKLLSLTTVVLATAMTLASCVEEVGDIFDGKPSSDARIKAAEKNLREALVSAKNGWVIRYYGAPETYSYGGYNIICKFNADSTVTCLSEQMYKDSKGLKTAAVTSHFKIEQSAGCILSFDEYNSVIHYFSDPVNPDGLGETGVGFDGDLEFRILSAETTQIQMKGKKHGARITMVPLEEDADWWTYFDNIKYIESEMVFNSYNLYMNDDTITVTPENRSLKFRYQEFNEEADSMETVVRQICYIITPEGISLYKGFDLNGDSVTGFKFIDDAESYPTFNNPSAKLVPELPGLAKQLMSADNAWYITYSRLGDYAKSQWDLMKTIIDAEKETLKLAYIGKKKGNFGIYFQSVSKKTYSFGYYFNATVLGDDEIRLMLKPITSKKDCDGDGYTYYNDYGYNYAIDPFGKFDVGGRVFSLTTDRKKKPTWIEMTDEDDPTNVIRLIALKTEFPFDN